MSEEKSLLEAALSYAKLGWSVFPLKPKQKTPLIKWSVCQKKPLTQKQITEYWTKWPTANIGLATGEKSGVIVIDIDSSSGEEVYRMEFGGIPGTIRQKTGKEGAMQLFFKHPQDGYRYKNTVRTLTDIDTRGDGGYVVLPPSIHPNGNQYTWVIDPTEMGLDDLMELPKDVKALFDSNGEGIFGTTYKKKPKDPEWLAEAMMGVGKGTRNDTAARLCGYYLHDMGMDYENIMRLMDLWNDRNDPPMEYKELKKTVDSIFTREGTHCMEMSVGKQIDRLEVLNYPDGTRQYNVYLTGHENYIQCSAKQLVSFREFRVKFMELSGYVPKLIKQHVWETAVNKALKEATSLEISEEETTLGVITSVINKEVFGEEDRVCRDFNLLNNRIVVSGTNGTKRIFLRIKTLLEAIRVDGEQRLTRKEIGETLRKLGFESDFPEYYDSRKVKAWSKDLDSWKARYQVNNQNV